MVLGRHSGSVVTGEVGGGSRGVVEASVWREAAYYGGAGTVPTP